jgi:hypothetical protein
MRAKATLVTLIPTITTLSLILTSCSSGPKGPEPGSPAFYWQGAKETWAAGDFAKTADNLERSMKGNKEHQAEALPWSLVLYGGLAKGYTEMADAFETGARVNKTNPGAFRIQMSNFRKFASQMSLQFAERFREFEQAPKTDQVPLAFAFPAGTQAQSPILNRISTGIVVPPAEIEDGQKPILQRGVILAATRAAGAGEDSSKAAPVFKSGDAKVARPDFMVAMATLLQQMSELYGQKKLDEPQRMKLLNEEAKDALQGVPDSKEVKSLNEKIQKALKPDKKGA